MFKNKRNCLCFSNIEKILFYGQPLDKVTSFNTTINKLGGKFAKTKIQSLFIDLMEAKCGLLFSDQEWYPALDFFGYINHIPHWFELMLIEQVGANNQQTLAQLFERCIETSQIEQGASRVELILALRRAITKLDTAFNTDILKKLALNKQREGGKELVYWSDGWFFAALDSFAAWWEFMSSIIWCVSLKDSLIIIGPGCRTRGVVEYIVRITADCLLDGSLMNYACMSIRRIIDISPFNLNTPMCHLIESGEDPHLIYLQIEHSTLTPGEDVREIDFVNVHQYQNNSILKFASRSYQFNLVYIEHNAEEIGCLEGGSFLINVKYNSKLISKWVFHNIVFDKFKMSLQHIENAPILFFYSRGRIFRVNLKSGLFAVVVEIAPHLKFCQFDSFKIVLFDSTTKLFLTDTRFNLFSRTTIYARSDKFSLSLRTHTEILRFLKFKHGSTDDKKLVRILKNFHMKNNIVFYLPDMTHTSIHSHRYYFLSNKLILVI